MFKYYFIFPFLILLLFSCKKEEEAPEPTGEIKEMSFFSKHVQHKYTLQISLPPNYLQEDTQYKVIYILDGNDLTKLMLAGLEELKQKNEVKEDYILVGIDAGTYLGRFRDLTPGVDKTFTEPTGDADKFYAFLTEELLPYIEENYRVQSQQNIILGHSLGGLFVLYSFFQNTPEAPVFSRFIALSPSIWYNDGILYDYERKFYEKNQGKSIAAKLYMVTGGLESVQSTGHMQAMYDKLTSRKYADFLIKAKIQPSTTHTYSKNDIYYDIESLRWTLD